MNLACLEAIFKVGIPGYAGGITALYWAGRMVASVSPWAVFIVAGPGLWLLNEVVERLSFPFFLKKMSRNILTLPDPRD